MRLPELFEQTSLDQPDFSRFIKRESSMPPLAASELAVHALAGEQRKALRMAVNGTGSILVRYKGREGVVGSMDESPDGETWNVSQVQGARSRTGFRVASEQLLLHWQQLLGQRMREYAAHPQAEVRRLTMPLQGEIDNIAYADSPKIERTYDIVRSMLDMRFSKELGLFVVDVKR